MLNHELTLQLSDLRLAICRLAPDAPLPDWMTDDAFVSITRTPDELSIVCAENCVPNDVEAECDWRMLRLKGSFEFDLTGILSSLAAPLAEAGIPVFAISTYDTDYLLIKEIFFGKAVGILEQTYIIEQRS